MGLLRQVAYELILADQEHFEWLAVTLHVGKVAPLTSQALACAIFYAVRSDRLTVFPFKF